MAFLPGTNSSRTLKPVPFIHCAGACRLGARLQGENGNFGGAAEADRQVDRANASVDVELHSVAQPEMALHISFPHLREKERGQKRETNLASVSMSGEHQGNLPSDNMVGEIGFVDQQDKRFLVRIPAVGKGGGEVRPPLQSILG